MLIDRCFVSQLYSFHLLRVFHVEQPQKNRKYFFSFYPLYIFQIGIMISMGVLTLGYSPLVMAQQNCG
jgi:hypothetical protein